MGAKFVWHNSYAWKIVTQRKGMWLRNSRNSCLMAFIIFGNLVLEMVSKRMKTLNYQILVLFTTNNHKLALFLEFRKLCLFKFFWDKKRISIAPNNDNYKHQRKEVTTLDSASIWRRPHLLGRVESTHSSCAQEERQPIQEIKKTRR